jgi:C4-dicarboxylate-specific signal transduction histidine kinase
VDEWNTNRLGTLQTLARFSVVQRFMEAAPTQRAQYQDAVTDALTSVDSLADDMDSVALMDATGAFVASSNPKDMGQSSPQRDYFQNAMQGKTFITGVSISTITNAPSVFHSAPVKNASGKVIGVIRSRSSLDYVMRVVAVAKNRVGAGGTGVLLDQDGLVIATNVDPQWLLRPVIPLKPEVNAAMVKDKRWGNAEQPAPLGESDLAHAIGIAERVAFSWRKGSEMQAVALPL